jgi:hypothetical protein
VALTCKESISGVCNNGSGMEYPKLGAEDLLPYVATCYSVVGEFSAEISRRSCAEAAVAMHIYRQSLSRLTWSGELEASSSCACCGADSSKTNNLNEVQMLAASAH